MKIALFVDFDNVYSGLRRLSAEAAARRFADDPARRAWHLGQAGVGPDEDVARQLEEAAPEAFARGNAGSAIAAMTRAASEPVARHRPAAHSTFSAWKPPIRFRRIRCACPFRENRSSCPVAS